MRRKKRPSHATIYGKIIAIVAIFSIYFLFISILQQQKVTYKTDAWSKTFLSAKVVCEPDGTASIEVTLLNKEGKAMLADIIDPQTGLAFDFGTVDNGRSVNGKIKTRTRVLKSGTILVNVKWKTGSGRDKLTIRYEPKECYPTITPTESPTTGPTQPPTSTEPPVSGVPTQPPVSGGVGLLFNPSQKTARVGDSVEVQLMVETKDNQILATDAYVLYDASKVQMELFQAGDFFPSVTNTDTLGTLSVRGIVNEPAAYRIGTGTLATLKFKVLQSGTSTLRFYCDPNASDSSKIIKNDINATNIIDCTSNTTLTVSTAGGELTGAPTITSIPTIEVTRRPTQTPGGDRGKVILMLIMLIFMILVIILGI